MTPTNKLVSLNDIYAIINETYFCSNTENEEVENLWRAIQKLPTQEAEELEKKGYNSAMQNILKIGASVILEEIELLIKKYK